MRPSSKISRIRGNFGHYRWQSYRAVLSCFLLCGIPLSIWCNAPALNSQNTEDPILLSQKIIDAHPEHWGKGASASIFRNFELGEALRAEDELFQLLESPGLTLDALEAFGGEAEAQISKARLLEMLKQAILSPQATSRTIARVTLLKGLEEYKSAFEIAGQYQKNKEISLQDAISFLDNRYGYAKLEDARQLWQQPGNGVSGDLENKKVRDKLRSLEKSLPGSLPAERAVNVVYEFYTLMEEEHIGIAAYEPYTRFREVMEQLNKSRIAQRRKYRSAITITDPGNGTVWPLNEPIQLKWHTENIAEDKSLRFFLVKGEMVVQELGTFKNKGEAGKIRLNKNIDSGDDYRVVAIEMFPANKYYIAKVASPAFSILRPPRKPATVVVAETPAPTPSPIVAAPADTLPAQRMSFEGREINYVKEVTVDASDIRISIWDHGRQDQDIVSIYLNGEPVVAKHTLTYRKTHFDVHLEASRKNDLFLYAHNLGFYPPNTVSIEIIDNSTSENIVLNSDLKSCEAVLINVRP